MLERDHFLLEPWVAATSAESSSLSQSAIQSRTIRALPEGAVLGCAVKLPARRWSWLSWLSGPSVLVREGEDASLLMTMRRVWPWSRCWFVRDADDMLVGRVRARVLVNAKGQVVARLETPGPPGHGRFIGLHGRELASVQPRPDGSCALLFTASQERNPFTRMLLLGAALALS